MKVLITGGAGYLGTELVGAVAAEDAVSELTIYDNLSRRNHNLFLGHSVPDKPIRFVQGDILDGTVEAEARIVDQCVDPAILGLGLGDRRLALLLVADVECYGYAAGLSERLAIRSGAAARVYAPTRLRHRM